MAMAGVFLAALPGCSDGEVEPTEAGREADLRDMEEAAAANDAAGGVGVGPKGKRRSGNAPMPP